MKSRRRIAFLKAQDRANSVSNYSRDLRQVEWGLENTLRSSNSGDRMSATGQKQTLDRRPLMSAIHPKEHIAQQQLGRSNVRYGSLADIEVRSADVRFTPKSGHC
jgi:hypothetical protein